MGNEQSNQHHSSEHVKSDLHTRAHCNGRDIDVGELSVDGVLDPSSVWKPDLSGDPLVFLSHRGPDSKEDIARPTEWFLSKILKIKTFFDANTMQPGDKMDRSLIEPANQCTHALIIISPTFRESPYCVKELNTFVARHQKGAVNLVPALWHVNDIDGLQGYAPTLKSINWLKADTWDAPTFLVQKLWPLLMEKLQRCSHPTPLKTLLLKYIQEARHDGATPPIPQSLETWYASNVLLDSAQSSMRLGQGFEEETRPHSDSGDSVASIFSSCSSLTNDSSLNSLRLSFDHVPIKAFGRSSDDKSYLEDFCDDSGWKYNWNRNPDGIGRDEANAFYYNAYVTYFKVQRVVMVDEEAKQMMICTPMNWAAYYIRKTLRHEDDMTLNRAYERGMLGATGDEIDKAFKHMHYRRCQQSRGIVYSKEDNALSVTSFRGRTLERQWTVDGFPDNGGWGLFLHTMLSVKIKWVAIVHGVTGVKNSQDGDGVWTLIFRDEEAELLMGEPRTFDNSKGLQFRGGAFGTFFRRGAKDILLIPKDRIIFGGLSERRSVGTVGDKIWKLDADSVCEELSSHMLETQHMK